MPTADPTYPRATPDRDGRLWVTISLVTVAFLMACQVAWINQPFDRSLGSQIGAGYIGMSMRAFDLHSWTELKGGWSLMSHPGSPAATIPYVNHPVLPLSVYYPFYVVFGRTESALRLPVLLLLPLTLFALARLARPAGPRNMCTALVIATTVPAILQYGSLVYTWFIALPCILLAVFMWMRRPSDEPAPRRFYLLLFIAALSDWNAYALVPALWIDLLVAPRPRPLRHALLVGLPFGLGFALNMSHGAWALGGYDVLWAHVTEIRDVLATASIAPPWWPNFSTNVLDLFGLPCMVLAALGLVSLLPDAARRRAGPAQRAALIFLISGFVACFVFKNRSGNHPFWVLTMAPGMSLCAALGVEFIVAAASRLVRRPRLVTGALLPLVIVVWVGWWQASKGIEAQRDARTDVVVERGRVLDREFRRGDVVIMTDVDIGLATRFYSHITVVPAIHNRRRFDRVIEALEPVQGVMGRLFMAGPLGVGVPEWARPLPWIEESVRFLPYVDGNLILVELDRNACFE